MLKPSAACGSGATLSPCTTSAPVSCAGYVGSRLIRPSRDGVVLTANRPASTVAIGGLATAPVDSNSTKSAKARRRTRKASHSVEPSLQPTVTPISISQDPRLQQPHTKSPDNPNSSDSQDGPQLSRRRIRHPRITKPKTNPDVLIDILVNRTQLPRSTAEKVVAARNSSTGIPQQPDKLCHRVQCLQQLLGTDNAELALRRFPSIVAYSSAKLAFSYSQWQLFFGMSDSPMINSAVGQQLQQAREQAMQQRLANRPMLLTAHVENLVANYYEMANMIDSQDYHAFAYRAMSMGNTGPDAMQDKLLRVLAVTNTRIEQQTSQQQQQQQQQEQQQAGASDEPGAAGQSAAAAAAAASEEPQLLSLLDLQAAARRDSQWLVLSADTLEQRLLGIQEALEVPMSVLGQMFLRNPSLLNKKPATLAAKAAALRALPGLQPERAAAAMTSLPSLLNLDPNKLKDRWQQLQQAAASHPSWRTGLDSMTPSSLAGVLIRGEGRYQRVQHVINLGLQHKLSLSTVFCSPDRAYEIRLGKATAAAMVRKKEKKEKKND